ncbi:hypothetical protein AB0D32_31340 [Micromonospora sp. NPDC048170]|uniref:hypothetical protein n=1 Tax=Micromonospora sp. NPDC048170 TaxID=3154819 RepID=UPI0033C409C7
MSTMVMHPVGGYTRRGGLLVPADVVVPIRPDVSVPAPAAVVDAEVEGRPDDLDDLVDVVSGDPDREDQDHEDDREDQDHEDREDDDREGQEDGGRAGGRGWRRSPVDVDELADRLSRERDLADVRREDELARRAAASEHEIALADVRGDAAAAARRQRERIRDGKATAELAELYRRAARQGTQARIRADIQRSAEMRALRVAKVQKGALWVGLPILIGFAGWSTPGVQAGMVRLLGLEPGSPGAVAAWVVEPLLIAVVACLIVVRAVLRMSGGDTDWRAKLAEALGLGFSIALNLLGGWNHTAAGWADALGGALGHSVGALGAAGTAWLIGVVIDYATKATPWEEAPRLASMDLRMPGVDGRPDAINLPGHGGATVSEGGLPDDVRTLLADVRAAIGRGELTAQPSGYAIYKRVMGGRGDKGRAYRVAELVAGEVPLRVAR